MIMKVFGITVNRRKPCTKEQAERGDETKKYCGLAQCEALQYFGHLVGHKNSNCHQICPFYSRTDSCICWPVKCSAGLYVHESHYTAVFQSDWFMFSKLPFTMIISTLLSLLFKNDEAFHVAGMTGKTLFTHLDSFSMLITALKSKLKNPAALPPTLEHMWMLLHFEREEPKATFKHSIPTEPCWDLQLPTHSALVIAYTLSQLPLSTWALNWRWTGTRILKYIPAYKVKGQNRLKKESLCSCVCPVWQGSTGKTSPSNLLTCKAALIQTIPYKAAAFPILMLRSAFFGVQLHLRVFSA